MRILLADDQTNVRFALRTLLNSQPGIIVVGEAQDAHILLDTLHDLHPDLVLLDWGLPGIKSEELIASIQSFYPELAIIVLSGRFEVKRDAEAAGADRFISKADPPGDLLAAIYSLTI